MPASDVHLSLEEIALYVGARGTADDFGALIQHVETCDLCRQSVAAAVRAGREAARVVGPEVPDEDEIAIGMRIGRYVVTAVRGSGAMGHVLEARDPDLDRTVALKVVRHVDDSSDERALREGRALGRLAHPNVVAVFDVGTWFGGVFLAMELVPGVTLAEWGRSRRSWSEVVQVVIGAGRGLAAAHGAGLVHRDVKPDNIVIGTDGRARVIDFGLAIADRTSARELSGTPAFMAPEVLAGARPTPASDQYALAVTMYELLEHQRPETPLVFTRSIPRWVRDTIARGLAAHAERFPDVAALVGALERGCARRRRFIFGGASAGVAAIATAALAIPLALRASTPAICDGADVRLAAVWNADRAHAIERALARTGKPYAGATAAFVERSLDAQGARWVAMSAEACQATARKEQSPELLDLRMTCLRGRLAEIDALAGTLEGADAKLSADHILDRVPNMLGALTPLDSCANAAELLAPVPLPTDPVARAQVASLPISIAHGQMLLQAARYGAARRVLETVLERARALRHGPTEAEALHVLGRIDRDAGEFARAEIEIRDAVLIAEAGRADRVKALAQIDLAYVVSRRGQLDKANDIATSADATLRRLGGDPWLVAQLEGVFGQIYTHMGKPDLALQHFQASKVAAETLVDGVRAVGDVGLAGTYTNIGSVYIEKREFAAAEPYMQRALAVDEAALGPDHPRVAGDLLNVALCTSNLGRVAEAKAAMERGLRITERAGGEPATRSAILGGLGSLADATDPEAALAYYQQAIAALASLDGNVIEAAKFHMNVGRLNRRLNRPEAARAGYAEARRIFVAAAPEHPELAWVYDGLAQTYEATGEPERALELQQLALALRIKILPAGDPEIAKTRARVARLRRAP